MSPLPGIYCITGGSYGVGNLLCSALLERGATVVNLSRTQPAIEHNRLHHIETDLGDTDSVGQAGVKLLEVIGAQGLAGFIANAGVTNPAPLEDSSEQQWRQTFEVNVFSHVDLLRLALPYLRSSRGRIVFTSSVGGLVSSPLMAAYCASKHAIEGIANSIRIELAPHGVHVSVVQPAAMPTEILKQTPIQIIANTSDEGPYNEMAQKVAEIMVSGHDKRSSNPQAAVESMLHALTAQRPRHHYPVGMEARIHSSITRRLPSNFREWLMKKAL